MKIYLAGRRLTVDPASSIGKGGEAEVFDLGDGRALKLFKRPDHPDYAGSAAERAQAELRIDEHQAKLPGFPTGLPDRVIVPEALARDRARGGRIVGYAMARIDGAEPLYRFAEPRFRRTRPAAANRAVAALRDLWSTVAALHGAGVVLGDFNDLNVLVRADRAYLIDADSFQFGRFPCRMFSERFVDPLRCAPGEVPLTLAVPHDERSDWFAFAVMMFRSLLCADPYGGVHRPSSGRALTAARRRLARMMITHPEVVYPKPAVRPTALPDPVIGFFEETFAGDRRGPVPRELIDDLRWTRCTACGAAHARMVCPSCTAGARSARRARLQVRGSVTAETVARVGGVLVDVRAAGRELYWLAWDGRRLVDQDGRGLAAVGPAPGRRLIAGPRPAIGQGGQVRELGGADRLLVADLVAGETSVAAGPRGLYRAVAGAITTDGALGELVIGRGVTGQTRLWVGDRLGLAHYRAGQLSIALLFDPDRPGVTEVAGLPPLRGELIEIDAVIAADRAYLTTVERVGGRDRTRCVAIDRRGAVAGSAIADAGADHWLAGVGGACATGQLLFVPTDAGLVRVEAAGGRLEVTRDFPDTAPFVDAASRLVVGTGGLYAVGRSEITRLSLASSKPGGTT